MRCICLLSNPFFKLSHHPVVQKLMFFGDLTVSLPFKMHILLNCGVGFVDVEFRLEFVN